MKRAATSLVIFLTLAATLGHAEVRYVPLECRLVADVESVEVKRDKLFDGVVVVAHGFAGTHDVRWATLKLADPVTDIATFDFEVCTRLGVAQMSLVGPVDGSFTYNVPPLPQKIVVRARTNSVAADVPQQ
jgi:hypothetical protein